MIPHARAAELLRLTERLEAEPHSACLLGRGGEILFVNRGWNQFASENGGSPACDGERVVGKTYFNFVDGAAPRALLEGAWLRVLSGRPVTLRSECSTPTVVRELTSRFLPVNVGGEPGAVAIHRVDSVAPIQVPRVRGDFGRWVGRAGRVDACTGCRRVRRLDGTGWDLVPALIAVPPPARWTFCPRCAGQLRSDDEPGGGA